MFAQKFYYDDSRDVFTVAYSHSGVGQVSDRIRINVCLFLEQISYPKTLVWVHKYRLPLFWKSELLFEYLFTTSLSLKSKGIMHDTIS